MAEILTKGERRYRYPFTNCTNCGPRWSIIRQLLSIAADVDATFEMCADCRREYETRPTAGFTPTDACPAAVLN